MTKLEGTQERIQTRDNALRGTEDEMFWVFLFVCLFDFFMKRKKNV